MRYDVEWSINVEAEIRIKSLSWLWFRGINIEDLPRLTSSGTGRDCSAWKDNDISVLSIVVTLNLDTFALLVNNTVSLESPHLEPS